MGWSLFNEKGDILPSKVFTNGKNQETVVDEVVSEIKKGTKIIFIHGVCGSGKSAIALNIARELGRASIVVPIKNLQRQYEQDYGNKKYVLKKDGKKLKISMITGRRNHICPYLKDNQKDIMLSRIREKDANLSDIFSGANSSSSFRKKNVEDDDSCDNYLIPCKIEIKSKNLATLKKYYNENPDRKDNSELDLGVAKRFAVAPACPYWNPILPTEMKVKNEWLKKNYKSVGGGHTIYVRKDGCPYYRQFEAYADSDVIIFNGDQYILETALGRKPLTDVEIIDECDEFLDNFALEGSINLTRLRNELSGIMCSDDGQRKLVDGLNEELIEILDESKSKIDEKDNVLELNKTKVSNLIKALVKSDVFEIMNDESYLEHCVEDARKFFDVMDESFVNFYKDKNRGDTFAKLVTINLDKLLSSLIEKNKAFVFMSGTLHSSRVLEEIFGLKDFKIIEAETFNLGTIKKLKTGLEQDMKFDNFERKVVSREQYLKALDKCVEIAKIPILVHVSAFSDMPSSNEIEQFGLKNLISGSELMEQQNSDREGRIVNDFKAGRIKILFTTRCNRGIDFPFETCNSVVITKFPYPNTQSLFWKILKKNKPEIFWDFYRDKAHRELLQKVYRSVRAADDFVFLLSPDIRVINSSVV
ncbi:MAG: helicase C-terminal domain-containing protein [Nanoarchaeota archaeon]